jgi:hypothetical protein
MFTSGHFPCCTYKFDFHFCVNLTYEDSEISNEV